MQTELLSLEREIQVATEGILDGFVPREGSEKELERFRMLRKTYPGEIFVVRLDGKAVFLFGTLRLEFGLDLFVIVAEGVSVAELDLLARVCKEIVTEFRATIDEDLYAHCYADTWESWIEFLGFDFVERLELPDGVVACRYILRG